MNGKKNLHKRLFSLFFASVTLCATGFFQVGCTVEDDPRTIVRRFTASFISLTRTSISDNTSVSWEKEDQVKYYCSDGSQIQKYTIDESGEQVQMQFDVNKDASYLVAVHGGISISRHSKDAFRLSGVINAIQDGSFANGHVAVARTEEFDYALLPFYNVTSFISFSTQHTDISYIVFTASDDIPIHGNGQIEVAFDSEGVPVASLGSSKANSIRVDLAGTGTHYITSLPVTLNNGFSISCFDASDKLIGRAIGKTPLVLRRSHIIRLGNIDSRLVDENGVRLDGYGDDTPWDPSHDEKGDISEGGYSEDYNWDSHETSSGNMNQGGFSDDESLDSSEASDGNVSQGGYGKDENLDSDESSDAGVARGDYSEDKNWNN
jgi:hypothetical protein